ncbi:MAG: HEAT repeat domain-containing protein [Acidobacteriota bacterium]
MQPADSTLAPPDARALLDQLPAMDVDEQLATLERLIHVPDIDFRRRVIGMGSAILTEERLVDFLRDEADDVRRNAGVEMLKLRRQRAFRLASHLLDDADPDVVLQAVLILSHLKDLRALEMLRTRALTHEDPNVVQEAVIALGRLGYTRALDDLLPLLDGEFWVAAAAIEALGRLGSTAAVPGLVSVLTDILLGPFAAEALTRIGGLNAYHAMARHWIRHHRDLDPAVHLRRLVYIAENLTCDAPEIPGFADVLQSHCGEEERKEVRGLALRCLTLLGGQNRPLAFF